MSSTENSARWRSPTVWARTALLTAILLGILGMHALDAHCVPSDGHTGPMASESVQPYRADEAVPLAVATHAPAPVDLPAASSEMDDGDHLGLVGICVAALAGLAFVLAIVRGRALRPWWPVRPRIRRVVARLRSCVPRPPTLAELSLLRC